MEEAQPCLPHSLLLAESPVLSGNGRSQSPTTGAQPCSPPLANLASPSVPVPRPEREVAKYLLHLLGASPQATDNWIAGTDTKRSEWEFVLGAWSSEGTPSRSPHHPQVRYERLGYGPPVRQGAEVSGEGSWPARNAVPPLRRQLGSWSPGPEGSKRDGQAKWMLRRDPGDSP